MSLEQEIISSFSYDPETGRIRQIPRSGMKPTRGEFADEIIRNGYCTISFKAKLYSAHRVAWLLSTGAWPVGMIDHRNNEKTDNRLSNIRDCNGSENCGNSNLRKDNSSGFKGVSATKEGRWKARITKDGKKVHLGIYEKAEDAAQAYLRAAKEQFGDYAKQPGLQLLTL